MLTQRGGHMCETYGAEVIWIRHKFCTCDLWPPAMTLTLECTLIPPLCFVCFDSLHPSQQFFSHIGENKVSCSRTQCSQSNVSGEAWTSNPSISNQALYHLATVLLCFACWMEWTCVWHTYRILPAWGSKVIELTGSLFMWPLTSIYDQGCWNTMPDLSDLVPFHSGQVEKFNLLVLGQVQNLYKVNTILYFVFWLIIMSSLVALKTVWFMISWFCFVLLLYVPSQQLWSWRDGQFT